MQDEKKGKFVSDDGVSSVPHPVTPAGGEAKKKLADKKAADDVKKEEVAVAESTESETEQAAPEVEVVEVQDSIAAIFQGAELSEEFKNKVKVVFDAAVNEEVSKKVQVIESELTQKLEVELQESLNAKVTEIVENLDKYLDYVVGEWMEENKVAIEAGIKVEMAESLMNGLKDLFSEHNIEVDEETLDIVTGLEEQVSALEEKANGLVNENIELNKEIASLQAGKVFEEMTESLTLTQRERLKVLSEKLDCDDLDVYKTNLQTIKESFFAEVAPAKTDNVVVEEDEVVLEEQVSKKPVSDYSSINALVEALNAKKSK
jgi:hypothetical protein